jgi:hypothetical protein
MAHAYSNIETVYAAKVRSASPNCRLGKDGVRPAPGRAEPAAANPVRGRGRGHRVARFSKWSTFE